MVILHVELEVIAETVDAILQERDLDFRGASIPFVDSELVDEAFLPFNSDGHQKAPPEARPPIATPPSLRPHGVGSKNARPFNELRHSPYHTRDRK